MNKKAQIFDVARKAIYWIIAVMVLSAMFIIFFFITARYNLVPFSQTQQIQEIIYAERFDYCFAYQDVEISRIYPELIDWNSFTQERFSSCYPASRNSYNFELKLKTGSGEKIVKSKPIIFGSRQIIKKVIVIKDGKQEDGELTITYDIP